jgi:hypothetical protein
VREIRRAYRVLVGKPEGTRPNGQGQDQGQDQDQGYVRVSSVFKVAAVSFSCNVGAGRAELPSPSVREGDSTHM